MPRTVRADHLQKIAERYGMDPDEMVHVGGFENSVYSFSRNGTELFLRVGSANHMTLELVEAEIDWVLYLVENGVPAVRPVVSENELFVECVNTGDAQYNVVAFEKANGEHVDHANPEAWDDRMIQNWGRTIGRLHNLAKEFRAGTSRRYEFRPDLDSHMYAKESREVRDYIDALFGKLRALPKTRDSYGLVHSDIHTGNFLVKDNRISAILDFDRSCYKWFASELAVALYYPTYLTKLRDSQESQQQFIRRFVSNFLEGYECENKMPADWIEQLGVFMKVREVILFMYAPTEEIKGRLRPRISGRQPYVDVKSILSS